MNQPYTALTLLVCVSCATALLSCDNDPPDIDEDFFNRYTLLWSADAAEGGLTNEEMEEKVIRAINFAEFEILIGFEEFESALVARALFEAQERGVAVKVVADADTLNQRGFIELNSLGVPIVVGNGALEYSPQPTVIVSRDGDMNRMTHNTLVVDQRYTLNFTGGFIRPDVLGATQVGFEAYSEDIAKDFGDELAFLHGGNFSTVLDTFNGPLKSNSNSRIFYPTQGPVLQIFFGPQERNIKKVIDEIYTARASVQIVTEEFNNRFILDALDYKTRIGLTTELIVASGDILDSGSDRDGDLIPDDFDNCPDLANSNQVDSDGDGQGNACDSDSDTDGDGIFDNADNCPFLASADIADNDGDGVGNPCDVCVDVANPDQINNDGDEAGDLCDTDDDNDTIPDDVDNCPTISNTDQESFLGIGPGDICAFAAQRTAPSVRVNMILIDALPNPVTGETFRTRILVLSQPLVDTISFTNETGRPEARAADGFMDSNMWTLTEFGGKKEPDVQKLIEVYNNIRNTSN